MVRNSGAAKITTIAGGLLVAGAVVVALGTLNLFHKKVDLAYTAASNGDPCSISKNPADVTIYTDKVTNSFKATRVKWKVPKKGHYWKIIEVSGAPDITPDPIRCKKKSTKSKASKVVGEWDYRVEVWDCPYDEEDSENNTMLCDTDPKVRIQN